MGPAQESADPHERLAAFVLATQPRFRRVAHLICGYWHHAEDITQTAFARVYSRWPRINADGDPGGYVHRAVVNAAVDVRRLPWHRERATDRLPDRAAAPDDGLTVEVLAALSGLPRRQRAVVVLRYVEDLDVEATAALLGISSGTVKSLAALRTVLGADRGVLR